MSQAVEEALPPYFNIVPDEALAELGAPVGAADFAEIARRCAEGRADLVGRGHEADGTRTLRRCEIPDPGRAGAFPPGAARQPRPA